jgi:DNA-directed RNA polymerase subunit alpha
MVSKILFPESVKIEKETESYGKFIAEPFERGYAVTFGNSLRRVLLSSIEGASITAVRVKGAPHEYITLPGVRESVLEIILNLKQVKFRVYSYSSMGQPEIASLKAKGKREVFAKDIQTSPNVEVATPDVYIASLEEDGELEIEMEIKYGYGYLPAEKQKKENVPLGTILVDAAFSPVVKVNYEVENVRVGDVTDYYERLILEIWTDSTVKPSDALSYAATIIKDGISLFILPTTPMLKEEKKVPIEIPPTPKDDLMEILDKPVDILELGVRASNCLKRAKITTIRELVRKKEEELMVYPNFGKKSLDEIKEKLAQADPRLKLGMEI